MNVAYIRWRSEIIKVFATAPTFCSPGTINIGGRIMQHYCDRAVLWKLKEKQCWISPESQQEAEAT